MDVAPQSGRGAAGSPGAATGSLLLTRSHICAAGRGIGPDTFRAGMQHSMPVLFSLAGAASGREAVALLGTTTGSLLLIRCHVCYGARWQAQRDTAFPWRARPSQSAAAVPAACAAGLCRRTP